MKSRYFFNARDLAILERGLCPTTLKTLLNSLCQIVN